MILAPNQPHAVTAWCGRIGRVVLPGHGATPELPEATKANNAADDKDCACQKRGEFEAS